MDKKKIGLWPVGIVAAVVVLAGVVSCLPASPAEEDRAEVPPDVDATTAEKAEEAVATSEPSQQLEVDETIRDAIRQARRLIDQSDYIEAFIAARRAYDTHGQRAEDALLASQEALELSRLVRAEEESRSAFLKASRAALEAWLELASRASTHEAAATASERAAGMQSGAFGEIDEVYYWFLRRTQRITPLDPPLEQKRTFDYGAAMLTYFELDPLSEHQDKYDEWSRVVESRLETLGWMKGTPKFERLRY